jgi:hypothetical protein
MTIALLLLRDNASITLGYITSRIVGTILAALIGYKIVATVYNQSILVVTAILVYICIMISFSLVSNRIFTFYSYQWRYKYLRGISYRIVLFTNYAPISFSSKHSETCSRT